MKALYLLLFLPVLFILISCSGRSTRVDTGLLISGTVSPGFEGVYSAFVNNFENLGEVGAAVCVYYRGEKVVDLWGGYADAKNKIPWAEDTSVLIFSSTKGLTAMCAALLVSRGLLDYDETVSTYWPEFAQNGKEDITVRQLLSHEAGLPFLDEKIPPVLDENLDSIAALLAAQTPVWTPGSAHGYHTATLGLYIAELIRRVDPEGRNLRDFFDEEIGTPLDLDIHIGVSEDYDFSRIAKIMMPTPWYAITHIGELEKSSRREMMSMKSAFMRSMILTEETYDVNEEITYTQIQGSGSGCGTARALAAAYSEFACGGTNLGLAPEVMDELSAPAVAPNGSYFDEVLKIDSYYSLGFSKPGPNTNFGSSRSSFGTPGAGGSFGFADPELQIGFGYVMTKMGIRLSSDPREESLRVALYEAIAELEAE